MVDLSGSGVVESAGVGVGVRGNQSMVALGCSVGGMGVRVGSGRFVSSAWQAPRQIRAATPASSNCKFRLRMLLFYLIWAASMK